MYKYDDNAFIKTKFENDGSECGSHYVTITGVIEDLISKNKYYIISSWGQKYVISEKEFYTQCNNNDSGYFLLIND